MRPTVYLETTVVSYLTASPDTGDLRQVQQELTREWWATARGGYDLRTSQFVLDEAAAGDPRAAADRLQALDGIPLLDVVPDVLVLADHLLAEHALPAKARLDALHLATAAVHRVQYLLTWNCKHLANARLWDRMRRTCDAAGLALPTICTPEQLLGGDDDEA
ncbi:MAG TPA: type II toxin-antitoxin system VapC family toxin [Tepidisphaeraceae bacterium]|nr:type II toxin-antitoxin system VapC family toxin [Tepidisphaeraceae bacterium]